MSERELNRIEVLAQIDDGKLGIEAGAAVLYLSKRQVFRLLEAYRTNGAAAIRHKARGRPANNRLHAAKRNPQTRPPAHEGPDRAPHASQLPSPWLGFTPPDWPGNVPSLTLLFRSKF